MVSNSIQCVYVDPIIVLNPVWINFISSSCVEILSGHAVSVVFFTSICFSIRRMNFYDLTTDYCK
ncbi:MAG: hypothetical protein QXU40_04510 [Candidatus Pacearchaeota archaeon]